MKKIGFQIMAVFAVVMLVGCMQVPVADEQDKKVVITNFEECVAAGNPVMESYPRQCNANGQNFTEEIDLPVESAMTEEEARDSEI